MSDQSPDFVPVTRLGAVAVLTMTYPERRNAFSLRMRTTLLARFDELMYRDDCRAIVLTGAANTFCAGGDISEMKTRTIVDGRYVFDLPNDVVRTMINGPKPVVAAVEGHAFGAGFSLACATDYVVAAANAKFCAAFIKIGLMPDTGLLWTLPKRVGATKARELMLLASEVDGTEALRIGIANRVAEPGQALAQAIEVAAQLATLPQPALGYLKATLGNSADSPDDAARAEVDYRSLLGAASH